MALLSLLPLRVLLSNCFNSLITGVLLSVCLVNVTVISKPTRTIPLTLITFASEISSLPPRADTPPSPQGTLYLQQPPKEKAVEGEDVVFSCLLKCNGDEEQVIGKVRWYVQTSKGRRNILQANKTLEDAFAGRVFLSGDVSMTLRNVSVEDQGLYLCVFMSTNSTILQGGGTKLSIRKESGVIEKSVGTIIGIVVAAVGVALGLIAVILSQFKDKLNCLQK